MFLFICLVIRSSLVDDEQNNKMPQWNLNIWLKVVLRWTVGSDRPFNNLSGSHLKMTATRKRLNSIEVCYSWFQTIFQKIRIYVYVCMYILFAPFTTSFVQSACYFFSVFNQSSGLD